MSDYWKLEGLFRVLFNVSKNSAMVSLGIPMLISQSATCNMPLTFCSQLDPLQLMNGVKDVTSTTQIEIYNSMVATMHLKIHSSTIVFVHWDHIRYSYVLYSSQTVIIRSII